ncbi:hypothetical protein HHK36_027233 [Tetracentron sinense]|uniref:Ion transport domain-containing protein n=1 Tax=Tetracentron sinense TaxID=13715 RepID=A0A835D2Y7_TETSI|nr:hypothetical protein HHK36_027233 [Tetracentron sinense]
MFDKHKPYNLVFFLSMVVSLSSPKPRSSDLRSTKKLRVSAFSAAPEFPTEPLKNINLHSMVASAMKIYRDILEAPISLVTLAWFSLRLSFMTDSSMLSLNSAILGLIQTQAVEKRIVLPSCLNGLSQMLHEILFFLIRYLLIARMVRLIRLLMHVQRYRAFVATFLNLIPSLMPYLGTIFCILRIYCSLGLQIFGGIVNSGNSDLQGTDLADNDYLLFNFNDYPNGMVTLFNLLVMGNWQAWMQVLP